MTRTDVRFASGTEWCAAWFYEPEDAGVRGPVVVMAHGLGGVREMRLDAFAERFCAAGYRVLVFDYRHFGASTGTPRQLLDIGRQLDDWAAALHHVRSLPQVDRTGIVLWGTSFSGGHVLEAAARDGGVAAVVAQCPFTDGLASGPRLGLASTVKVGVRALRDLVAAARGRAPVHVRLAGGRGSAALMTAPDVLPGYEALKPPGAEIAETVPARIGLRITTYRPGRAAARLLCPVFFAVCTQDSVAPAAATLRHARRARKGTIRTYDTGHFDIYVGTWFERVVADEVAFLAATVPVSR